MTLVLTGALSMGGSTADRSINCELGCSGTAEISLNDAGVRSLAGVPAGEIAIDDFYGASSYDPGALGNCTAGGFYMGTIFAAGSSYYLIMAPNATGCTLRQWKTTETDSGVGVDRVNGYGNTYDHLANADHPAGNWTATRSINGFSDWYLPAMDELNQLYANRACSPAGEGFFLDRYWSSTEYNATCACVRSFSGFASETLKEANERLRAIRRVPF